VITLRTLREKEYPVWDAAHRAEYARGLVEHAIDENERGRGYGGAAMRALEDDVRPLGYDKVGLNIWGGDEVARELYRSLGWAEESVHMRKRL
jgi:GNAT superfamily N-acetyltransferase